MGTKVQSIEDFVTALKEHFGDSSQGHTVSVVEDFWKMVKDRLEINNGN